MLMEFNIFPTKFTISPLTLGLFIIFEMHRSYDLYRIIFAYLEITVTHKSNSVKITVIVQMVTIKCKSELRNIWFCPLTLLGPHYSHLLNRVEPEFLVRVNCLDNVAWWGRQKQIQNCTDSFPLQTSLNPPNIGHSLCWVCEGCS